MEQLKELKHLIGQISDLGGAMGLLSWDQETYMPPKGAEARAQQMATLARISHELMTGEKMGGLLEDLKGFEEQQAADSMDAAMIRVARRDHEKRTRIPVDFVEKASLARNRAHHAWIKARQESNFALFQDNLQEMMDLAREGAELVGYEDHPYNAVLDDYEEDAKVSEIKTVFASLRDQTLPLLRAVLDAGDATDYSILNRPLAAEKQKDFALKVARDLGLSPEFSRLDTTTHPFQTNFSIDDIRITTRYDETYWPTALYGVWHETGHGLYEHGVNPELERTNLARGTSLGIHESQSRMVENMICRSRAFWQHYGADFSAAAPEVAADLSAEELYRAVNRVQQSLIRVEADELTYNFHIMLRFELELELFEGTLAIKDLPEAWNQKMQDYLGITPPNDALGVLQDIHWSSGLIGYFPTYSLGNLYACQLWNAAAQDLGDMDALIAQGEAHKIIGWMRENVHQYGKMYSPRELIQKATGAPLNADHYVKYLNAKYRDVYGI
ncbi:carboxypeptidase M32 [Deinococcus roseus]|uniref:Metal-dependent carboxypeptidase n=1 Tax=Deinococcus roseus TaxID=392414 RepID=A0ABQ2D2E5_9DEIO|nr:carboxypeptidase M32 [Deinococcus roseus]GGJ37093.1 carboxypeptidase M32 [Deinococcus roseus]